MCVAAAVLVTRQSDGVSGGAVGALVSDDIFAKFGSRKYNAENKRQRNVFHT
jgi:hypothetical protein